MMSENTLPVQYVPEPPLVNDIDVDGRSLCTDRNDNEASKESVSDEDHTMLDILGNGQLCKTTIRPGLGKETRPKRGDIITIGLKCWVLTASGSEELVEECESLSFTLGDGDVVHALDLALPFAEIQEVFTLKTDSRFAYGHSGRNPDIPPDSTLRYQIEFLKREDALDYGRLPLHQRIAQANQKCERGNYYHRREEYTFALNSYTTALKIMEAPTTSSDSLGLDGGCGDTSVDDDKPFDDEIDNLAVRIYNNIGATQLKLGVFEAAIKACDSVLCRCPNNFKALYRKSKALLGLGDAEAAIPLLSKALELVPNSHIVSEELSRARLLRQQELKRLSSAVRRMYPKSEENGTHKGRPALTWIRQQRWLLLTSICVVFSSILLAIYLYGRYPVTWQIV